MIMATSDGGKNSVILEDRKIQAYKLCKEYLGGSWKNISFEEFHIKILSGGLSNELFICTLPDDYPIKKNEQRKVLLRIYGQLYGELASNVHALVSDVMVFALLSERDIGPKLFAIFPEGRLEELIPAKTLSSEELRSAANSVKIARKLKQYHEMSLPLTKEPTWMWEFISRLLQVVDEIFAESDKDLIVQEIQKKYDLHKEFNNLRNYITASKPLPVVFCHNDLQQGNILAVPQSADNDGKEDYNFQFIDFEYSAYNYRGYDIANHFCEWIFDYTLKDYPHFGVKPNDFPTKHEQLIFIRAYLGKDKNCHFDKSSREEEETLEEVKRFTMCSHFLWAVWAVVQSKLSTIEFGFAEYALKRFQFYDQQKKILGLS